MLSFRMLILVSL